MQAVHGGLQIRSLDSKYAQMIERHFNARLRELLNHFPAMMFLARARREKRTSFPRSKSFRFPFHTFTLHCSLLTVHRSPLTVPLP
jgi:hypothetical protein